MGLVLLIYTNQLYKESYLPIIDNANYELVLRANELNLRKDVDLLMEVVGGQWSFRQSAAYHVFSVGSAFEGLPLQEGQILQILTGSGDKIAVLVYRREAELNAYRKLRVRHRVITVGKNETNDICYPSQQFVSQYHAEISYRTDGAYVRDQSKNGTYVGTHRVVGEQRLRFGDVVSVYGLTILYLGEILAVSCLGGRMTINEAKLQELNVKALENRVHILRQPREAETVIHISPRVLPQLYGGTETIENVPQKKEEDKKPAWMSILPSLTMVLPMLLGCLLMAGGALSVGIIISGGSAVVGVSWATINLQYAKKTQREQEQRRLARYEEYLVRCADQIRAKFEFNRRSMLNLYPSAEACSSYHAGSAEIWARKREYSDFLYLRLGLGEQPFQVKINVPAVGFAMIDDELAERPAKIARSYQTLRGVPLGVMLTEHNVIGILTGKNHGKALELARVILTQIAANHCYTEAKIAVLYDGSREYASQWEFVRWLPHVWNEDRSMRFIASNESEANEVLYALAQMLRTRAEQAGGYSSTPQKFYPHYVLVVEYPSMLESQMISKYLYEEGRKLGITTIMLADVYERLPSVCDFVIESNSRFQGVYAVKEGGDLHQAVQFDHLTLDQAESMACRMSSMRVNQVESSSDIPNSLTFFDMMGIHRLEELNVLDRWRKNRTYESMRALIGQKAGGQNCYLDINERYHGPHGLVAGTTGSGKSETLQTYILSLAINFSPQDVGLFIIDFKGGGMANLFSNLPHTMGQISNLSGNQVRRAMVSIKSENMRRQRIFSDFGVNHIDAYTKLVKNHEATVPIPHLLIIIDEFAELKREQPEFMRELISVAQVGRSLGVHLILATQKPSGTVDDNIWSNTKFKLCLRVADKQDSNDMLHKPDAAYLTQAGRCYLQVGNDEIYELFQSGWSGATYDARGESVQNSAVLLDLQGREAVSGSKSKSGRSRRAMQQWMQEVACCILKAQSELPGPVVLGQCSAEDRRRIAKRAIALLNQPEQRYLDSNANLRRMEDVVQFWPSGTEEPEAAAELLIETFRANGRKLPEQQEKTQLDAIVGYLAEVARENNFENKQLLWMPVLPERLYLQELPGYRAGAFRDGGWTAHQNGFQLSAYVGLVDDPENQAQMPLVIDLAARGHLTVVGGVTSGKSTFLQTLLYSLVSTYSPAELNLYAIDFSSQMLSPFEEDAHVGGVILEGEDDRLNKFFGMAAELLQNRKKQIKGGSFSQYIQLNGNALPAVVIVIDGYANFREKTEGRFEDILLELSRSAEGYGIYLIISCAGLGSGELQSKIADNMRQSICLELGDKFSYGEALRTMHFDVLPEQNVKGRGLALVDGSVLEYQTALACQAENDYARSSWIKQQCALMSSAWPGKRAGPVPEIPKNPTWERFCATDQYRALVAEGNKLPVAYYQSNAALYSVDLSRTFCYLVLGRERSGKTVFLRNLACAARDAGGTLVLIDRNGGGERKTAELTGADYAASPQELFAAVKKMIMLTNERAPRRKALLQQGFEDEEIYQIMRKEFVPAYFFLADFGSFLESIYTNLEGIGKLNSWVENIFAKGRLLNVHIFAVANVEQIRELMTKPACLSFVKDKVGVLLGGELSKQSLFAYQNISFSEQGKRLKAGLGYATNQEDNQSVDLIVIPQNKGMTGI